jgi:single-strand DNA-binding protein
MSSRNRADLIGFTGGDPEQKSTSGGGKVVLFSLATSEVWTDKTSGEKKERTQWHRIVIFNDKIGEIAMKFVKKGARVGVVGQIETRQWEKDGVKHYTTEIVLRQYDGELLLLDRGEKRAYDEGAYGATTTRGAAPASAGGAARGPNDDIPF